MKKSNSKLRKHHIKNKYIKKENKKAIRIAEIEQNRWIMLQTSHQ